jgi:hypothetical protein
MRREEYVHFFFCVKLPGSFMSFFFLDGFVDWIPPPLLPCLKLQKVLLVVRLITPVFLYYRHIKTTTKKRKNNGKLAVSLAVDQWAKWIGPHTMSVVQQRSSSRVFSSIIAIAALPLPTSTT